MSKNATVTALEALAKKFAKAKPGGGYALLVEAFVRFAVAGESAAAQAMIRLAYEPVQDADRKLVDVYGTGPMDVFCFVHDLGDVTRGEPRADYLGEARSLAERVAVFEDYVRYRLTSDAYTQFPPPEAPFEQLTGRELWRKAQILARPADDGSKSPTEREALAALTKYMAHWMASCDERGAGYGQDIVLALDLALRHGAKDSAREWFEALGSKVSVFGPADLLCLPMTARAAGEGFFRTHFGLPREKVAPLRAGIEAAARAHATASPRAMPAPSEGPIERVASAEYSQFHLVHQTSPRDEVFFQTKGEGEQGMSIFATQVAIGTPSETLECFVEIRVAREPARAPSKSVVQAVAFPFTVTGPLLLRSVAADIHDDGDPIVLPNGAYDVLAQFHPMRATTDLADTGLRRFRVTLDFHPRGSLGAPKCIALEYGDPPREIVVNGSPTRPSPRDS